MRRSSQSPRNPRGSTIVGKAIVPGIPAEHDQIEDAVAFQRNVNKLQEEWAKTPHSMKRLRSLMELTFKERRHLVQAARSIGEVLDKFPCLKNQKSGQSP